MSLAVLSADKAFDWMKRGSCRGKDQALWYPTRGESCSEAKLICHECPVELSCRAYGIEHETIGVWGGLSERERKRLRRDVRLSQAV